MDRVTRSKQKNTEKKSFLQWLRSWPIDWVAVVTFFAVLAAAIIVLMPTETGEESTIVEVIKGEATVLEAEARLSKEMTPIAIDETSPFYEAFVTDDRVNILLLGINDGMTDTIMLATYDMDNQKVDIISIPRDTYYYRKGYDNAFAFNKINAIYHSDGVVKLAEAVSEVLYGMPIHYYALIDYKGVRNVMDVIGGVEFDVPFHMKYDDNTKGKELHINIPKGLQTIDGSNVMEFLRFRHTNPSYAAQGYKSYPGGDIQRIQVQQEFVKLTLKKCLKAGNIIPVAKAALENVESDLTYSMAVKIGTKAVGALNGDNINTHMLPGVDRMMHELSFWIINEQETQTMLEEIFIKTEEPEEATTGAAVTSGSAVAQ